MTAAATRQPKPEARSRETILRLLKLRGAQDAASLAGELAVTAMAVRQHLYALRDEGLVIYEEEARPVGRPAKLWRLTPAAERYFPDAHAELSAGLLAAMGKAFGDKGLAKLLKARGKQVTADYRKRVDREAPLAERVAALATIRESEGYMAGVEALGDAQGGGWLLVENHCPICVAARACSGLCQVELEVFRKVLGKDAEVERVDHILAGARRCAYRITAKG
ncbi:transcriptional regulator [Tistlia consotensis]|uniref:Predicted transcriptional regulator, ArsR family n=1 Tax=Tistlia consotensis USBA 355 TaxID=560819 RepID=A0A1Y6BW96_9PROT|nr:metalloregulator ArsR/SmtB family transcription factor [Tistlia consotensis]SMF32016.1 Predicted transcriptional regulator, ArsR family [Tistlia consotensis USBA 355]SNR67978.1 transcriptional regulator [Tistlia consotensis]